MATVTLADGVELRLGNTDAAEVRDITPYLKKLVWVESLIRGGFFWELSLAVNVWREWNDIILGRDSKTFQIRLTSQEGGRESSTEWRTAVVDSSDVVFRGEAILTNIRGGDRRLNMLQETRHRAWPQSTVAEIIRTIAPSYNLNARADDTPNRIDRWQINETDWEFMHRLVFEEASVSGRGDLFLWLDEDLLRLSAPPLSAPSARRHDMDIVENRVDRIRMTYQGRRVDRAGGATLQAVGFDFGAKVGVGFTMDGPAAQTQPALAGRVPRDPGGARRVMPVTYSTPGTVESRARGRWSRFAPRYFGVAVDTRPDLALRAGQILEVQASLGRDQDTPFLGRFLALEVQHEMSYAGSREDGLRPDGGSILTSAVCYRREAYVGEEDPSGAQAETTSTRDNYVFGKPQSPRVVVPAVALPG